ncbi:MAG: hypothetical protein HJJLKODD_00201 [Phycisphaerae bacterium]|nr:hypothetical protein [Phycisphaerae bacterium]
MLARYKLYRGKRPAGDPLPKGMRQDTRYHTHHILRPTTEMVKAFLDSGEAIDWQRFRKNFLALLTTRFKEDRAAFDKLAELARHTNLYIGCNCPTQKNPRVEHCHTYFALQFMQQKYPDLKIRFPALQ